MLHDKDARRHLEAEHGLLLNEPRRLQRQAAAALRPPRVEAVLRPAELLPMGMERSSTETFRHFAQFATTLGLQAPLRYASPLHAQRAERLWQHRGLQQVDAPSLLQ